MPEVSLRVPGPAPFSAKPRLLVHWAQPARRPGSIAGFDALLEYRDHKPFECVGEGHESRAALAELARRAERREDAIVERFIHDVQPQLGADETCSRRCCASRANATCRPTWSMRSSDAGGCIADPPPPARGHLGPRSRAAAAHTALRQRLPELPLTVFCSDAEAHFMATDHAQDRYVTQAPSAADLGAFDVVIKSPGISAYRPELIEAQRNGTRFTGHRALVRRESRCARDRGHRQIPRARARPAPLIAHLLRALGGARRWPETSDHLLELLDPPQPIRRISGWSSCRVSRPAKASDVRLAVITNIEEEHLDWHGSRERYVGDKLARPRRYARLLLVNDLQAELLQRTSHHARRLGYCHGRVACRRGCDHARRSSRFSSGPLPLPGLHNAMNACAALAAVEAVGEDALAAADALATFRALPHCLQALGERDAVDWVDDSIATTPQATIEALRSLDGRKVSVIVGGRSRSRLAGLRRIRACATAARGHRQWRERPPHRGACMRNRARIGRIRWPTSPK
ncbi:MAG: Mur ligase family protein [Dokdonella sp.]